MLRTLQMDVTDLRMQADREYAKDGAFKMIQEASKAGKPFELVVRDEHNSRMIYGLEGLPVTDRTTGENKTVLTESYQAGDPHRDNTWMYSDVKPGKADIQRTYFIDEGAKPGRTAGWVMGRMDSLFEELARRFPDYVKTAEAER